MLNLLLEVSKPMTGSGANNRDVKKSTASERFAAFFLRPNLAAGACGKSQQQLADRIAECQRTDGDGTGAGGRHL